MEEKDNLQLPENAFRELKDGEEYKPLMSPDKVYPEVNGWSVTWGIVMAVIFSAAAAYLGLKVGQVFEAAIPIAIIAVGVSTATKRSKALGENVIIQSIGACSGDYFVYENLHGFGLGRSLRNPFPYSFPQVLRKRYARQVSVP